MTRNGILSLSMLSLLLLAGATPSRTAGETEPQEGEARIRYLFHSGWAVKTAGHYLIFDYVENGRKPMEKTLENGFIDPRGIAGENVTVFVSHAHGDHYDPVILKWKGEIPKLRYVFGWQRPGEDDDFYFGPERKPLTVEGMEIRNIHHEFDGIPESAFLVSVDGLAIYFAGDHGSGKAEENPVFKGNIDYLAGLKKKVDLLFTPTFGGEWYAIKKLKPNAVFPMHDGGYEGQYKKFAERVRAKGVKVEAGAAERSGDTFFYSRGKLGERKNNS